MSDKVSPPAPSPSFCSACCNYSEYAKIIEVKEAGLVIYRQRSQSEGRKKGTSEVFISFKDDDSKTGDQATKFNYQDIPCARCRHNFKREQLLSPSIRNKLPICDHCKKKMKKIYPRSEAETKYGEQKSLQFAEATKTRVKHWLSQIQHELKDIVIETKDVGVDASKLRGREISDQYLGTWYRKLHSPQTIRQPEVGLLLDHQLQRPSTARTMPEFGRQKPEYIVRLKLNKSDEGSSDLSANIHVPIGSREEMEKSLRPGDIDERAQGIGKRGYASRGGPSPEDADFQAGNKERGRSLKPGERTEEIDKRGYASRGATSAEDSELKSGPDKVRSVKAGDKDQRREEIDKKGKSSGGAVSADVTEHKAGGKVGGKDGGTTRQSKIQLTADKNKRGDKSKGDDESKGTVTKTTTKKDSEKNQKDKNVPISKVGESTDTKKGKAGDSEKNQKDKNVPISKVGESTDAKKGKIGDSDKNQKDKNEAISKVGESTDAKKGKAGDSEKMQKVGEKGKNKEDQTRSDNQGDKAKKSGADKNTEDPLFIKPDKKGAKGKVEDGDTSEIKGEKDTKQSKGKGKGSDKNKGAGEQKTEESDRKKDDSQNANKKSKTEKNATGDATTEKAKRKSDDKGGTVNKRAGPDQAMLDDMFLKLKAVREKSEKPKPKPPSPPPPLPKKKSPKPKPIPPPVLSPSDILMEAENEKAKLLEVEHHVEIVVGNKVKKYKHHMKTKKEKLEPGSTPLFKVKFKDDNDLGDGDKVIGTHTNTDETVSRKTPVSGKQATKQTDSDLGKGITKYALSDRTFIEKGWTMLPTEKVVRKMNVYRMRPAHPEFDWFERNKDKGELKYDTGEPFADLDEKGRGRWFYKNGRQALDYYDAEELNAGQRIVVYGSGETDERGRTQPHALLATFDYLGNGVVFDHNGKIRLKYNQTEGVILDRSLGPVSHWKWHSLNDPPVLQQVMIDTQAPQKDPNIIKLGGPNENKPRPDNEEMLAIEFDNFIKEKSKKLTQKFKPFQIKMKALKINEHFSLRVLDQASIYLLFKDGSTNVKLNLGMLLDHREIVDTEAAEVGEVCTSMDRQPARTDSLAALQRSVAAAQRAELARTERLRRLRPTAQPCASLERLRAPASQPPRRRPAPALPAVPALAVDDVNNGDHPNQIYDVVCYCKSRKPCSANVYYDTSLI